LNIAQISARELARHGISGHRLQDAEAGTSSELGRLSDQIATRLVQVLGLPQWVLNTEQIARASALLEVDTQQGSDPGHILTGASWAPADSQILSELQTQARDREKATWTYNELGSMVMEMAESLQEEKNITEEKRQKVVELFEENSFLKIEISQLKNEVEKMNERITGQENWNRRTIDMEERRRLREALLQAKQKADDLKNRNDMLQKRLQGMSLVVKGIVQAYDVRIRGATSLPNPQEIVALTEHLNISLTEWHGAKRGKQHPMELGYLVAHQSPMNF
jgi:hypothetical protein